MTGDPSHQGMKIALGMGTSLSDHGLEHLPWERRVMGNFNCSKFLEYMRQFKTSDQQEKSIKKAFDKLDKDGSGYIEWNEIKYILSIVPSSAPVVPLSDEAADAMIQAADSDGDGRISFKEFSDMVKQEKFKKAPGP